MGFFAVILVWTACWLIWNTSAPAELRFDPFPAFVLWLFISNFIQLFLLPLLLLGQNLEDRHAEIRARADLEVNRRAEQEIEAILARLEKQNELLAKLAGGGKDRK
ncbi:MAG: Membrane protein-like protein [Parcubacteria group bacterium GW2011_GWB1_56_8]|nr:MAG: Membrane protein-like protein [Parcubacteria group bacterium GW2011_GWB1_56_8]